MSWIEKLWTSTVKPGASIKGILSKLALKAAGDWLTSGQPTDLNKANIYTMVKDHLNLNWRSAWQVRLETGERSTDCYIRERCHAPAGHQP
jgi:hypothetical protein